MWYTELLTSLLKYLFNWVALNCSNLFSLTSIFASHLWPYYQTYKYYIRYCEHLRTCLYINHETAVHRHGIFILTWNLPFSQQALASSSGKWCFKSTIQALNMFITSVLVMVSRPFQGTELSYIYIYTHTHTHTHICIYFLK